MHQRERIGALVELGVPLQCPELLGEGDLLRLVQVLVAEDEELVVQECLMHRFHRQVVEGLSQIEPDHLGPHQVGQGQYLKAGPGLVFRRSDGRSHCHEGVLSCHSGAAAAAGGLHSLA